MSSKHVAAATSYAKKVVAGKIPACEWVKRACRRQLNDVKRAQKDRDWPYYFDADAAERICKFAELMPHVKGVWVGQRITLEPWQSFVFTTVFGWRHRETWFRRFRTVYLEVPRKNSKSTMTAIVALYMTFLDGEGGAECYSAATKMKQARIVFETAQAMARRSTELRLRYGIDVFAHNINQVKSGSKFEPIDAEAKTQDGLNVHLAAIDELHAHKTRLLYDVLETATGSRAQPLVWNITTSGSNRAGICYEQRIYVTKVLQGIFEDDSYFGIIYTIDDGDDWTDPEMWAKANPNLGVSKYIEDLESQCRKAKETPAAVNAFKMKHLDVWVSSESPWMPMNKWDACADPSLEPEQFVDEECILGLDLASKIDIVARAQVFKREGEYYGFCRFYLPEATIEESRNSQYLGWVRAKHLIATPGEVTDYDRIRDEIVGNGEIVGLCDSFDVRECAFDPYQARQLANELAAEGLQMIEVRPTVLNFSEPMKELEALVRQGRFHHDGCPVLAWMMSNVVCHRDNKDNIYPRKEREENKIDGVVALIMALNRLYLTERKRPSVYQSRGVVAA